MFSNKTIRIGNSEVVLYHDSKTNLIGIISGNVGDIHCDVNGSVLGKVHKNVRGVGGNVLGGIGGYVKDGIKGHVGGDVLRVDGNVLNDVKGRVLGKVVGGVGSHDNEQIENKKGDDMEHGDSFFQSVTDGIKELTFEQKFMNGAKFAIENKTGTNYAFNPPSTMSLEKGYKQLLTTKKETGTNDLNQYIDYYEDVFYQEVFIYAINQSLKYGLGVNHKFTVNEVTLQSYYMKSLMEKAIGKKEYDICIKAYEHAFIDKDNEDQVEDNIKNETGEKMEQVDSEVKMNELGSLEYMYERMQQIRQGKRDGYVNKLDEALDSFEAIMLAESQLYEAVHNCKDGTDNHKSTETHNHTETDKVTDTVMPDEGKKKDGGKEVDGGKKAKHDLADDNKPVTTLPAYDEERATINALIDKVERYRKEGNFNYDENDVKETPENFKYRTTRQSLINFYGEMLNEQKAGSDKWNPCIQKYQDVFPVNGFIVAVKIYKQGGDSMMANTKYKFGTHQSTLHNVYKEMRALAASGSHKWDTCIKAYKEAFPISSQRYAITQETVFYLNNKG